MNYIISIEGQNIPVPEDIGATDEAVKRTLAPIYPEAANAMITRTEKDGTTTITVVKRAGSKGTDLTPNPSPNGGGGQTTDPLEYLAGCAGGVNPAVALFEKMRTDERPADALTLMAMESEIQEAITLGDADALALERALKRLVAAQAQPAHDLVMGF